MNVAHHHPLNESCPACLNKWMYMLVKSNSSTVTFTGCGRRSTNGGAAWTVVDRLPLCRRGSAARTTTTLADGDANYLCHMQVSP
jgi:hypothetical protein